MTMRVLHCYKVFGAEHHGGIGEVIARVAAGTAAEAQSSLLVCRTRGIGGKSTIDGIPVEFTTSLGEFSSLPISPTYAWRFRQRLRDADVIALHAPFPLADLAIWPGLHRRHALVIHWHGEIVGRDWLKPVYEPLVRSSVARADRILVTSEAMIDPSPFLRSAREKCRTAPYGIDAPWWSDLSPADRDAIRALRQRYPRLVAACGRLVPYKGFDVLIRAMAQVDGHLMIVGSGPLEASLRGLAAELGLGDRVTLTGFVAREQQRRIFQASRMLVMSSVTVAEAFGVAQLEGMCCGLPVINTNLQSTVPHVARHEREGLTVEPRDAAGLAAAITRLLDDPGFAARLGQAGQARARENFGWRGHAARVMQQYREALASRAARQEPRTVSREQNASPVP